MIRSAIAILGLLISPQLATAQCNTVDYGSIDVCDQGYVHENCTVPTSSGDYSLTILSTNDVRGRSMPVHPWDGECELNATSKTGSLEHPFASVVTGTACAGGIAGRTAFVEKVRAEVGAANTLLLDAGNYYFGNLWYQKYKGGSDVKYVNNIGYDAMGAGQCEFFTGTTELFDFLKNQDPSVVTVITNLDFSADSISNCKKQNGPSCVKPWDVIVKNNRKIGLLGFVPSEIFDIATPGNTVSLIQYTTAAQSAIAAMKTVHPDVDIIIAMSSMGHPENILLAESVEGQEIDIIIGGNHEVFKAGDTEGRPFPRVITDTANGDPTYIVSSGHFGTLVGRLDVTFDVNGKLTAFDAATSDSHMIELTYDDTAGEYLPWSGDNTYGGSVWDLVRKDYVEVEAFKGTIEGQSNVLVSGDKGENEICVVDPTAGETDWALFTETCAKDPDTGAYGSGHCCINPPGDQCCPAATFWSVFGCRHSDCPMGRFATDALMFECTDCAFAFANGGSIRGDFAVGDVTYGDLIGVFPFQNTISTFNIKGSDIKTAMEHAVSEYLPYDGEGKFLVYSGLRFAWNPIAVDQNKILAIEICSDWDRTFDATANPTAGKCAGDWLAMVPQTYYKAATNNYIRAGGDGFDILSSAPTNVNDYGIALEEGLKNYLKAVNPYDLTAEGVMDETTCTGEVNNFKDIWAGTAGTPQQQTCRTFRSSGLTELTCPMEVAAQAFCENYSGDFVQDLASSSGLCVANQCSGFGGCNNATYTCECRQVDISDFKSPPADLVIRAADSEASCGAGFSMWKGESCEIERKEWKFGALPLVFIFAVVNIICSAFAIFWYKKNGKYPAVRITQPLFHEISAAGGIVAAFGSILLCLPATTTTCHASITVSAMGLMILYGAVFQKTSRVNMLINNKKLKKVRVSNMDLIKQIFALVFAELVVIIVLIIIAPIYPTASPLEGKWEYAVICSAGDKFEMWVMVLIIIQFGVLGYGCVLAFKIRKVAGAMNESFYIGLSLYTSFLIGIIAIFVVLNSLNNPDLVFMLGPVTINIVSIVSVLSTLVPKAKSLTPELKAMSAADVLKLGSANTTMSSTNTSAGNNKEDEGIVVALTELSDSEIRFALEHASPDDKAKAIEKAQQFLDFASK
ncbi:hypothetical protein TrVE_jg5134 [Triparma verrucosa]|uniref:G-protein coupled receptors family 3 profile domain-containing protein n=1 Tax=Triparma verrucosa TaxID=1606542 RepID=A0A9W7BF64_9STRA|nr:hypothetical protein TrVE_jg5134 [Triparma verrucosa]